MLLFEAWCRPHGLTSEAARFAFVVAAIDTRAARQIAMKMCFYGSNVRVKGGGHLRIDPLAWTVCRVKALDEMEAARGCSEVMEWPRPEEEFANAATHAGAVARLYAGRLYDSYRIQPSRSVLDFCRGSRVVRLGQRQDPGRYEREAVRTERLPQGADRTASGSELGRPMLLVE